MKQEIIEKTYELVDEIKSQDSYKKILKLKKEIDTNLEIIELVNNFQRLNKKYEEVSKYSKYHPDLKRVQQDFSKAKIALYTNDVVKEYKELEKKLQKNLNHISTEISVAVSAKIKHPNELGLINKH